MQRNFYIPKSRNYNVLQYSDNTFYTGLIYKNTTGWIHLKCTSVFSSTCLNTQQQKVNYDKRNAKNKHSLTELDNTSMSKRPRGYLHPTHSNLWPCSDLDLYPLTFKTQSVHVSPQLHHQPKFGKIPYIGLYDIALTRSTPRRTTRNITTPTNLPLSGGIKSIKLSLHAGCGSACLTYSTRTLSTVRTVNYSNQSANRKKSATLYSQQFEINSQTFNTHCRGKWRFTVQDIIIRSMYISPDTSLVNRLL